jgi:SAM-dependent methyltransferase
MRESSASFTGSIPEHYDSGLGPILFAGYAADLARRTARLSPARVLETAAGTGIVTRALRNQLPAGAHLVATDLNPPMLKMAQEKFRPDEQVEFSQAEAGALPFLDESFDAVVCQFGVMFFTDKDRAYREAYRVLAPGGHYLFNVWESHRYNPFARIAHEGIGSFFPADPPQFYLVPFSYNQVDAIEESLINAGFMGTSVASVRLETEITDVALFARGLVYGNPVIDQIRAHEGADPGAIADAIARELCMAFGGERCRMPLRAIIFAAARPM